MRILHTSDWHLGRSFGPVSLHADQAAFLDWLVEVVVAERVDLVVVAGDLYDRAIPPTESVALLRDTLDRLVAHRVRVVAIAGNHDGPERLAAYDGLTDLSGVLVRGGFGRAGAVTTLELADGPLDVVAVPYLDPVLTPPDWAADATTEVEAAGPLPTAPRRRRRCRPPSAPPADGAPAEPLSLFDLLDAEPEAPVRRRGARGRARRRALPPAAPTTACSTRPSAGPGPNAAPPQPGGRPRLRVRGRDVGVRAPPHRRRHRRGRHRAVRRLRLRRPRPPPPPPAGAGRPRHRALLGHPAALLVLRDPPQAGGPRRHGPRRRLRGPHPRGAPRPAPWPPSSAPSTSCWPTPPTRRPRPASCGPCSPTPATSSTPRAGSRPGSRSSSRSCPARPRSPPPATSSGAAGGGARRRLDPLDAALGFWLDVTGEPPEDVERSLLESVLSHVTSAEARA